MSPSTLPQWIQLAEAFLHYALWPLAVVLLAYLYKSDLSNLMAKLRSAEAKGFNVQFGEAEAQQTMEGPLEGSDALSALPPTIDQRPIPDQERLEKVRTYGGEFPPVLSKIDAIRADLTSLGLDTPNDEVVSILIRQLAVTQLGFIAERFNRIAYDSQVRMLVALNEVGLQPATFLRTFYEEARTAESDFYSDYTFDRWIQFPIKVGALALNEDGQYGITDFGRDLIEYVQKNPSAFSGTRRF